MQAANRRSTDFKVCIYSSNDRPSDLKPLHFSHYAIKYLKFYRFNALAHSCQVSLTDSTAL